MTTKTDRTHFLIVYNTRTRQFDLTIRAFNEDDPGRVVLSAPTAKPLAAYVSGWVAARDELEATGADMLQDALAETT